MVMMPRNGRLFLVFIGLGWRAEVCMGQITSNATCTMDLWTVNNQGQSPCLLGSALESACFNGTFNIPPLSGSGSFYLGAEASNKCQCSTVTYSLVSACAACQGQSFLRWTDWIRNCSAADTTVSIYPLGIPPGATIPNWAFLNITGDNAWNATKSLNSHNSDPIPQSIVTSMATEITVSSTLADTSTSSTPTIVTVTTSALVTSAASSNSSSFSRVSGGVIAAAVVGGVIVIALIIIGLYCVGKRRKKKIAKVRDNPGSMKDSKEFAGSGYVVEHMSYGSSPLEGPHRLYDPTDPATFPPTPPFDYKSPDEIANPPLPVIMRGPNDYGYGSVQVPGPSAARALYPPVVPV